MTTSKKTPAKKTTTKHEPVKLTDAPKIPVERPKRKTVAPKAPTPTVKSLQAEVNELRQQLEELRRDVGMVGPSTAGVIFGMMGELFTGQANRLRQPAQASYLQLELASDETTNANTLLLIKGDKGHYLIDQATGQHASEVVSNLVPAFLDTLTDEQLAQASLRVNLFHYKTSEAAGDDTPTADEE